MNDDKLTYNYKLFNNGIRIIHKQVASSITHAGVVVNTGTRDENENEAGIAHFIEHVIFKGTHKRNTYQVLSYLENVGGDLNAYTTKEETFFYASALNEYFPRCMELLADILFRSTFHTKDIETEKEVVKEEIKLYKDTPSELIFDEFENLIFQNHSLGTNILGTLKDIKKINQKKIFHFMERTYNTDQMLIAVVGNIPFEQCVKTIEKYFASVAVNQRTFQRIAFSQFEPRHKKIKMHTNQAHAIVGRALPNYNEHKNHTATLLNNILGGQGLNSRLNLAIREKTGYVYHIESTYSALSDVGLFTVYIGADHKNIERCFELAGKEMKKLREHKLGTLQLHRSQLQLIGQTCIAYESNLSEMLSIAKNHLLFDLVEDIPTIVHNIRAITETELLELANEMLTEDRMSSLIISK
ncbi:MAG: insulinase family protein [Bacteroidales bacterium]|jgi:predicted Zn-dependent peptidase|nr:insulinase family protein [Bacteroidales bacterium]